MLAQVRLSQASQLARLGVCEGGARSAEGLGHAES